MRLIRVILRTPSKQGPFRCRLLEGEGFACPLFSRRVGQVIMESLLATDPTVVSAGYEPEREAFVVTRTGSSDPEVFPVRPDGSFPIGAYLWPWTPFGCEECSWYGWSIRFEDDPDHLGQIQRCESCLSLEHQHEAISAAREMAYQVDDQGEILHVPLAAYSSVVLRIDVPTRHLDEALDLLREDPAHALEIWSATLDLYKTSALECWIGESADISILPSTFDLADLDLPE